MKAADVGAALRELLAAHDRECEWCRDQLEQHPDYERERVFEHRCGIGYKVAGTLHHLAWFARLKPETLARCTDCGVPIVPEESYGLSDGKGGRVHRNCRTARRPAFHSAEAPSARGGESLTKTGGDA